jgi:hypothetical protein
MARHRRLLSWLAARIGWGLVAVLPACAAATQEWIYDKPNVTPAQLDRDKTACRKVAPSQSLFKLLEDERVNRDLFNRCMQSRGYTVTVVPHR